MSSIWSSGAANASAGALSNLGTTPSPGGRGATKFQSVLQAAGRSGQNAMPVGMRQVNSKSVSVGQSSNLTIAGPEDTSTDSPSTISANDFLTLLVTEMQNQDPTAQTDPNEYINQLVQINSLEQLISINQNLAEVLGAATSPVAPSSSSELAGTGGGSPAGVPGTKVGQRPSIHPRTTPQPNLKAKIGSAATGNLSLPKPSPASRVVSHALDGHSQPGRPGHAIRDIPIRAMQP